jgi:hypothetical protein
MVDWLHRRRLLTPGFKKNYTRIPNIPPHEAPELHTPDTNLDADERLKQRYPTLGADAVSLAAYDDIEAEDGDLLVYDQDDEDAWIQSDVHADRADLV